MKLQIRQINIILLLLAISLACFILFLPVEVLEFLSLEVVGEPPINGRTWLEGVVELGGEISMRFLGILGVLMIILTIPIFLDKEKKSPVKREVKNGEIVCFVIITGIFCAINMLIGYGWWDPNAFLGMGSLFAPSIVSLIVLGLMPEVFRRAFGFTKEDLAVANENLQGYVLLMIIIAFGYGLISCIWHCCSFYDAKMFFFFFVIKLIQLWAITSFFFKYGLKLFLSKTKPWIGHTIVSLLFGFCYPWHTIGFAITFTLFGYALCFITSRSDSYIPGLALLYFAYIFHAGLPWHGQVITFTIIIPLSVGIIGMLIFLRTPRCSKLLKRKIRAFSTNK